MTSPSPAPSVPPRVRFAPSPTGSLHIGGVRTAFFNWLYARHHGGSFLLRIEDTDRERSTPQSEREIIEGLNWLGLESDEAIPRQSERTALYQSMIDRLLAEGNAYRCVCRPEELEAMRAKQKAAGLNPAYNRRCRDLAIGPDVQVPFVIRFKAPLEGLTSFHDEIRGTIPVLIEEVDDFVIQRTDGSFIYNLVAAVDDVMMKITHVIRGEDHVKNTPKQILLDRALGFAHPAYAHLPLILGADKTPLSKRHGATSLEAFRKAGYPAEALLNYLVRLGWGHGDQEIFTIEEMIRHFTLDKVSKSNAVWDNEKLDWLSNQYIQKAAPADLRQRWMPFLPDAWKPRTEAHPDRVEALIRSLQPRSKTLVNMREQAGFYFDPITEYEEKAARKAFTPDAVAPLTQLKEGLASLKPFDLKSIESLIHHITEGLGIGMGKIAQPARVALTGKGISPGIYEVIEILGREESIARLGAALDFINRSN